MNGLEAVVHCDPDIMSGAAVFVGTRVPVKTLFECLADGEPLDEFLEGFPTVDRATARAALEQACVLLADHARSD